MRNVTDLVNAQQGFRLKGWFKPAVAENSFTQETFSIHICYLAPKGTMTEEMEIYENGNFR